MINQTQIMYISYEMLTTSPSMNVNKLWDFIFKLLYNGNITFKAISPIQMPQEKK